MDLAIISAGDTDIETTRITCLHTSCLGFAPLIFHLQPSFGFNELMRTCEPVWIALDADPSLPEKLVGLAVVLLPLLPLCEYLPLSSYILPGPWHEISFQKFLFLSLSRMQCSYTCTLAECNIFD